MLTIVTLIDTGKNTNVQSKRARHNKIYKNFITNYHSAFETNEGYVHLIVYFSEIPN